MENITSTLFSPEHSIAYGIFEGKTYPHEALPYISEFIIKLGESLDPNIFDKKGDGIWIARSAKVAPSAYIGAPCIIDENAEVRHCAFIRGSAIVGKGAVVGNSTELKNVILFDGVQVPHYNYVGDSILGYKAHLGAGAVTSNVKSDKTPVALSYGGERFSSGMKKLGAMVGDHAEIGCGSVLNPGSVIGKNATVYPLSSVRGHVDHDCIYKKAGEIVERIR